MQKLVPLTQAVSAGPVAVEAMAKKLNVNEGVVANPSFLFINSIYLPVTMRPQDCVTDCVEDRGDPGVLLKPLATMLREILGEKMVECLQKQYSTLRAVVETSSPTTQCARTLTDSAGNDICWICLGPIVPGDENFSFECEHAFPIAQALCFTGLFSYNIYKSLLETDPALAAQYLQDLADEYGPSHRICNQFKNDSHFIVYRNGKYEVDKDKIREFLNELKTTPNWGTGRALCAYLQQTVCKPGGITLEQHIENCVEHIAARCQRILDRAEKFSFTAEQHATLTAMHLKAFFANDPTCGNMQDVLPEYTKFATPSSSGNLPMVNPPGYIQASEEYMTKNVDYFSNILVGELVKQLDGVSMPALTRARLKLGLAEKERIFKEKMKSLQITGEIKDLALQCMVYLQKQIPPLDDKQLWSRFQIDFRQLILVKILDKSYTTFKEALNEDIPLEFDFNGAIDELYNRDVLQFAGGLVPTPSPAEYTPSNTEMSEHSISSLTPEQRSERIAKAKSYLAEINAIDISDKLAATPPFFDKSQYNTANTNASMTGGKRKRRKSRRRKSIRRKTVNRRTRRK